MGGFKEPLGLGQRHLCPKLSEATGQGSAVDGNYITSGVCLNTEFNKKLKFLAMSYWWPQDGYFGSGHYHESGQS